MTIKTKRRYVIDLHDAIARARYLARSLVKLGRYESPLGTFKNIPATDQRDIVAFIFLEVELPERLGGPFRNDLPHGERTS